MRYRWLSILSLATAAGCGGRPLAVVTAPRTASAEALLPGLTVGRYRLTGAEPIEGAPLDSVYRFTDGTSATVSAFRYDVPADVREGRAREKWTEREGLKFEAIQPILVSQGRIESFRVAFSDLAFVAVETDSILEHSVAVAVRSDDEVWMDFQYLYLVCGRFLKLRGSFARDAWQQSEFPNFSRELMRVVRASSARLQANDACY